MRTHHTDDDQNGNHWKRDACGSSGVPLNAPSHIQTNSQQIYPVGGQPAATPVHTKIFTGDSDVVLSSDTMTSNVDEGFVFAEIFTSNETVEVATEAMGVVAGVEGAASVDVIVGVEGVARAFWHMHL